MSCAAIDLADQKTVIFVSRTFRYLGGVVVGYVYSSHVLSVKISSVDDLKQVHLWFDEIFQSHGSRDPVTKYGVWWKNGMLLDRGTLLGVICELNCSLIVIGSQPSHSTRYPVRKKRNGGPSLIPLLCLSGAEVTDRATTNHVSTTFSTNSAGWKFW